MAAVPNEIVLGKHINGRGHEFTFHYIPSELDSDGLVTLRKKVPGLPDGVVVMSPLGMAMLLIDAAKQSETLRRQLRIILAESEPEETTDASHQKS